MSLFRAVQNRRDARTFMLQGLSRSVRDGKLNDLRRVMFTRGRDHALAFYPLNEEELGLLEVAMRYYCARERLRVLFGPLSRIQEDYAAIRANQDHPLISPEEFRAHSDSIVGNLLERVSQHEVFSDVAMVLPWRAGLAFAFPAHCLGIREFCHLGIEWNKETLAATVSFVQFPVTVMCDKPEDRRVIIAAPALATGNTALAAISVAEQYGILPRNMVILSVVAAPEGVDHVLSQYPRVQIVTGALDEHLDEKGCIVPGLGNYDDQFFEGIGRNSPLVVDWLRFGILSQVLVGTLMSQLASRQMDV